MIKFNIQFFAEEATEVADTPVETVETETEDSNVEDSQPDTEEEAKTEDYSDILNAINGKAVVNGESTAYESFDDVIKHIQMANNAEKSHKQRDEYKARVEELENSASKKYLDKFIKDAGFDSFGEYKDALDIQELMEDQGLSEEMAEKYLKGQKALTAKEAKDTAKAKEERQKNLESEKDIEAFNWFKDNGYGELTSDKIDKKTWDKVNNDGLPLKYALMEQMYSTVKGDAQQETIKKLQNKNNNSVPSAANAGEKQTKSVWDLSDAEFDKQLAKAKRGY